MNIIFSILIVLVSLIALLLIIALFIKKQHYVKCEIIINSPLQKVFDYLKFLKNQNNFNKHAMADPDRIGESKGIDGTVGYIYSWNGDKSVGEGQKEIISIIEGKMIETEIRFVRPITTRACMIMETQSLSSNQTKVSWSNAGALKFPINIFIPIMQRHVAKDMDSSLATLKSILEK
jgi:hypothetical protein